ncbi:hypothetical protein ACKJSM_09380 [Pseudomonas sp. PHC1]|uniref:hypothetical protein n=1 Tax=Pseudomonas sp. PHC1 TaxID=3384759 RepID=UPI00396F46DC
MSPRTPFRNVPVTPNNPPDTVPQLPIQHFQPPGPIRVAEPSVHQPGRQSAPQPLSSDTLPAIQVRDLPVSSSAPHSTGSIRDYELAPQTRTLLPNVNAEGLRVHRGRIYAEVQYTTTTTVMVAWDESVGTYRAMRPQETHASGPALHFDPDSNTWRVDEPESTHLLVEPASPRQTDNHPEQTFQPQPKQPPLPQSDMTDAYVDTRHYVWDQSLPHHHGYVVMHRKMRLDDSVGPPLLHAFMDESGAFVRVASPSHAIDQPAELLPAWTDRDIWDLYGLQGEDITRFRTEAHQTGKKPQWARVRAQRMENKYLYEELRRWLGPEMDHNLFNRLLEHQRLTPAKWAEHLESVTLHRRTPDRPPPLPRLPTPDTPEHPEASTTPTPSTHLTPSGTPQPTATTPAYGDHSHYTWDLDKANFHGYVEMRRKPGLDHSHGPLTQVAFPEGDKLTIVRPVSYSVNQRALRPYWRDIDIWNLYRIEGEDIVRFRQDVALHMKQPTWVEPREYPSLREQLINYLRLWTNPDSPLKPLVHVIARYRPYNLSTLQLGRLCKELSSTGQFKNRINDELPAWVKTHQERTTVLTHTKEFDPFVPELHAEIIRLRNQGEGFSLMKASLSPPFFERLLVYCGFKRNAHGYLYRTDIPAVFKVDSRTPFDIARPSAMLPQEAVTEATTSGVAVSALFSLKAAMGLAKEGDGVTNASEPRPDSPSTDRESQPPNGSTSGHDAQRIRFCYVLDTRTVEVVPGQDNLVYNPTRIDQTRLPSRKWEGHVSVSSIGFTSRRVWLVNSSMTRAATVGDIHAQALGRGTGSSQNHADAIQARTRAGDLNRDEYDVLIDELAKAGRRVLELPAGKDIFSNDIVFPPETITL